MPVFDYRCNECDRVEEMFQRHWDDPAPACPSCGGATVKMASRFSAPFMGSINKYTDLGKENSHIDGWWAYRKRSSVSGQPEPVWIGDMQQLREFNKAEGLAAPGEVPTNATISSDGKKISSAGMPGQWGSYDPNLIPSGIWRATKSLTSLTGKDPAPSPSGPPVTAQVADAKMMESFSSSMGEG